jgi:hypothetical protein
MEIDLTKRIQSLQGNFIMKRSLNRHQILEEYGDDEGNVDVSTLPEEYHQTWGDIIELAIVNYEPENKQKALHANTLATKIIGSDSAEIKGDLKDSLIKILEQVTYENSKIKWWVTTPIISELEG